MRVAESGIPLACFFQSPNLQRFQEIHLLLFSKLRLGHALFARNSFNRTLNIDSSTRFYDYLNRKTIDLLLNASYTTITI